MGRKQQNITYTFVNPNDDKDVRKALQTAIIEKLLLLHRENTFTAN